MHHPLLLLHHFWGKTGKPYPDLPRNEATNRMSTRVLTSSSSAHRFWGANQQPSSHLVLRPKPINHRGDFEAQITKPYLPVLRPKLGTLSTLVLRLNLETRASRLLVHDADHTQCHLTSRLSGHRVPRPILDHPQSSTPSLLLLPRSSLLPTMSYLSPTHHETSKMCFSARHK
jgi:hypothetical protein